MDASIENPIYTVFLIDGNTKYDLTPAVTNIEFSDQQKQMAQRASISIANIQVNGRWLASIIKVRQRVFIYADDGTKNDEIFRGFVWTRDYKSSLNDREITLRCYDNLIYFQQSDDSKFFPDGKNTKDVLTSLCSDWGVKLEYSYESIKHSKLALRGTLSNIFTSDVLDLVKDRTGKKYVIRSEKDVMKIMTVGQNRTVYNIEYAKNAVSTKTQCTMEGVVTKVVILGKSNDDGREPIEATVSDKTDQYGTLQKIINRDENTSLADAKKEAQGILKNDGSPKWEYGVTASDIPWIRKGDLIYVSAGDIYQRKLIVVSVDRNIGMNKKSMTLTCEDP